MNLVLAKAGSTLNPGQAISPVPKLFLFKKQKGNLYKCKHLSFTFFFFFLRIKYMGILLSSGLVQSITGVWHLVLTFSGALNSRKNLQNKQTSKFFEELMSRYRVRSKKLSCRKWGERSAWSWEATKDVRMTGCWPKKTEFTEGEMTWKWILLWPVVLKTKKQCCHS